MIVRNRPTRDFTVIRNEVLDRQDMSLKAKGLYCFLMSKPDGWHTSIRGLEAQLQEGKDSIAGTLQELGRLGYYQKTREHDPKTGKISYVSTIFDSPERLEKPRPENPVTENPRTVNPPQVKTKEAKTQQAKTHKEPKGSGVELAEPTAGMVDKSKPEINEAFAYWTDQTGIEITARVRANRFAASNLLRKHGAEALSQIIRAAAAAQGDRFAPRIGDFCALQQKLPDLIVWAKQQGGSHGSKSLDLTQ